MKFSVLMSIYNSDNPYYLYHALYSLVFQTKKAEEIIIIGDGPLPAALQKIVEKFSRILPIKFLQLSHNVGLGEALNYGLRYASCEWVFRMDSDDISRPYRFDCQLKAIESEPELDIVGGFISEFSVLPPVSNSIRRVPLSHEKIISALALYSPFNHVTVAFRKSKVIECGSYIGGKGFQEDFFLWLRMADRGAVFLNLNEILVDVRVGNDMLGRRKGFRYLRNEIYILRQANKKGYCSYPLLVYGIILRSFIRLAPDWVRKFAYTLYRKIR